MVNQNSVPGFQITKLVFETSASKMAHRHCWKLRKSQESARPI